MDSFRPLVVAERHRRARTRAFLEHAHTGAQQLNRAQSGRWRPRTRNPGEQPDCLVGRHGNVVRRAPGELGCGGFRDALHAAKRSKRDLRVLIRYRSGTQLGLFGPFMQG